MLKGQSDPLFDCLSTESISTWQPLDITTYVLTVFQIEEMIAKLNRMINRGGADALAYRKDRDNWLAVLDSYRSHTASMMPVFTVNHQLLNAAVNSISSQDADFEGMVSELIPSLDTAETAWTSEDVLSTFSRLKSVCGDTSLRSASSTNLCDDFNPTQWASLASALDHVCTLSTNGTLASNSILNTTNLRGLCDTKAAFAFLQDTTKYLSFASHSPVTMKFTSTVSNYISVRTAFHSSSGNSSFADGSMEDVTIHIGGGAARNEQDEISTRDVTIDLGDNNKGPI